MLQRAISRLLHFTIYRGPGKSRSPTPSGDPPEERLTTRRARDPAGGASGASLGAGDRCMAGGRGGTRGCVRPGGAFGPGTGGTGAGQGVVAGRLGEVAVRGPGRVVPCGEGRRPPSRAHGTRGTGPGRTVGRGSVRTPGAGRARCSATTGPGRDPCQCPAHCPWTWPRPASDAAASRSQPQPAAASRSQPQPAAASSGPRRLATVLGARPRSAAARPWAPGPAPSYRSGRPTRRPRRPAGPARSPGVPPVPRSPG
ncbi:hypothetical protein BJY54_004401 [Streptomyces nodosus]|nr:hypothetical protein [Streptomyces nodosus]